LEKKSALVHVTGNLMISLGQYSISLRKRHVNRGMDIQTVLLTLASLCSVPVQS